MTGDDIARLLYLSLLLCAVGGYVLVHFRGRLGQALQQFLIWALIGVGLMAGYGLWDDIQRGSLRQAVITEDNRIELPRAPDGHYHITLSVNETPVDFLIDTGATDMVLSRQDAVRVGIDPATLQFFGRANTANGVVETARITLDAVRIGPFHDRNVPARVTNGALAGSLLGMRYLERFDRLEITGNRMVLERNP